MKLLTFQSGTEPPRAGLMTCHGIIDLAETSYSLFPESPALPDNILQLLQLESAGLALAQKVLAAIEAESEPSVEVYDPATVKLKSPVLKPGVLLDFYTFEQHVKTARAQRNLAMIPEWYQYPVYYYSNPRTLKGPDELITFPTGETRRDYELELAVIIGKRGKGIAVEDADAYIAGYTIMNDWSARAIQQEVMKVGLGPAKGKDFATSLGPWLVTPDEIPNPRQLQMLARINGEEWSRGNSGDAYYTFAQMIAFVSENTTLYPGDVIGSGTVGTGCGLELGRYLQPGDYVELEIEHLGVLGNSVA